MIHSFEHLSRGLLGIDAVREIPRLATDDAYVVAAEKIAKLFASAEAAEGMAAFLDKRKAEWKGL